MSQRRWQEIASERKEKQNASIPSKWRISPLSDDVLDVSSIPESSGILTDLELQITNTLDVEIILKKLAVGEWNSVTVTTAFYKRAIIAQQLTNCLTEIFIDRALQRAAEVDEYLKREGRVIGPLHGLPVSLKDQFNIKGLETIMGYVSWVGKVADKDAVIIEILYECGAVPFVRTNVPQTLMWGETFNNVFGRTTNPYNRKLTSGGSSGGEGALIALRGSPVGIGTDIGGSVRIPSNFCGLYALRPSYNRLPYEGAANSLEGQEAIHSVIGPLASHISTLKIFTKAVLDTKPWNKDPSVVRKAWNQAEYELSEHGGNEAKLCFAVMLDNGVTRPHPPVRRAVNMVVEALREAGHTVIDWENHRHQDISSLSERIYSADGGEDYREQCSGTGEPIIQTMMPPREQTDTQQPEEPHLDHPEESLTAKLHSGDADALSTYELWKLHKTKREIQKEYLDHWQNTIKRTGTGRPVDALLSPAAPYAAPPHGLNSNAFYTILFNVLNYACATIPVTTVDQKLDLPDVPPKSFYNREDEEIFKLYTPETFRNSPVGIQVVGQVQEEEAVIRMTEIVDSALKAWKHRHKQS